MAGWWTLLIAVLFMLTVWGAFLAIMHCRPVCLPALWGGLPWETVQTLALWMIAAFRVVIWTMFLVVVWLTIWSAKLKHIQ